MQYSFCHQIFQICYIDLWNLVVQFALDGKCESPLTAKQAKALSENIQLLNSSAFATDEVLFKQKIHIEIPTSARLLGVPLINNNNQCLLCKSYFLLRRERPAQIVVYDDLRGTLPASHFHKYFSRGMSCVHPGMILGWSKYPGNPRILRQGGVGCVHPGMILGWSEYPGNPRILRQGGGAVSIQG